MCSGAWLSHTLNDAHKAPSAVAPCLACDPMLVAFVWWLVVGGRPAAGHDLAAFRRRTMRHKMPCLLGLPPSAFLRVCCGYAVCVVPFLASVGLCAGAHPSRVPQIRDHNWCCGRLGLCGWVWGWCVKAGCRLCAAACMATIQGCSQRACPGACLERGACVGSESEVV